MVLLKEPSSEVLSWEDHLSGPFSPLVLPCLPPPHFLKSPQAQTLGHSRSHSHSLASAGPSFSYSSYCSLSSSASSVSSWLFSPPPPSRFPPVSDGKLHSDHHGFFCSWGSKKGALDTGSGSLVVERILPPACLPPSSSSVCKGGTLRTQLRQNYNWKTPSHPLPSSYHTFSPAHDVVVELRSLVHVSVLRSLGNEDWFVRLGHQPGIGRLNF